MVTDRHFHLETLAQEIRESGLTIYSPLVDHRHLYLDSQRLEKLLKKYLLGLDLNYPLRTRSKVIKSKICEVLGYPVPKSFKKTRPRFPGQNFDTYVQKSDNLQIWNEDVIPSRRYVLIRVDSTDKVTDVRVVIGEFLAELDTTGTLTQKFQASSREEVTQSVLNSPHDTDNIREKILTKPTLDGFDQAAFLPIASLYGVLLPLVGQEISDPGVLQDRNRGAALHRIVCNVLPRCEFGDTGQFPDVPAQLLELKLQTSPTIDLGLVCPDETDPIADFPELRHCDIRYAVFYGRFIENGVLLDHLILTTGADFFNFFQRFEGKVLNKKIQIPLPHGFFRQTE